MSLTCLQRRSLGKGTTKVFLSPARLLPCDNEISRLHFPCYQQTWKAKIVFCRRTSSAFTWINSLLSEEPVHMTWKTWEQTQAVSTKPQQPKEEVFELSRLGSSVIQLEKLSPASHRVGKFVFNWKIFMISQSLRSVIIVQYGLVTSNWTHVRIASVALRFDSSEITNSDKSLGCLVIALVAASPFVTQHATNHPIIEPKKLFRTRKFHAMKITRQRRENFPLLPQPAANSGVFYASSSMKLCNLPGEFMRS